MTSCTKQIKIINVFFVVFTLIKGIVINYNIYVNRNSYENVIANNEVYKKH